MVKIGKRKMVLDKDLLIIKKTTKNITELSTMCQPHKSTLSIWNLELVALEYKKMTTKRHDPRFKSNQVFGSYNLVTLLTPVRVYIT